MKLFILAVFLALTGASFVDFLTELQNHHSFQRLPEDEKLLFGELVIEAENDELTAFIDRVGLVRVLKLMDHMSHYDAEKFAAYLAEHSNYTHHAPDHGDVIHKRDDDDDHHGLLYKYMHSLHGSFYQALPQEERTTLTTLMQAAAGKHVNEFIYTAGYGAIFGLLEHLDDRHTYEISRLIENALAAEAELAEHGHVKRDYRDHYSNFYSYLSALNSQYYEHLPDEERQTYHDLLNATHNHNVTEYIHTHGYGPVFGFLEHLDSYHANQVYDYLANTLNAEAAADSA